jgi:hypothetical protein
LPPVGGGHPEGLLKNYEGGGSGIVTLSQRLASLRGNDFEEPSGQ